MVSVLFADIVGFTSLSESLDAEDVSAVQDQYFAEVRDVVGRYGGRLEKFIGDAAMAVFGVPRTRDDDAERAVRAGLALIRSMEALHARIGLEEGSLRLRVGVNSGEVAYSPGGDGEWRVSGDPVNVAARLQTAAQPGTVLVGDTTALAVADVIALDAPVDLDLKGKSGKVRAWRAVTPLPHRSRERAMGSLRAPLLGRDRELAHFAAALERVRRGATETLIVVAPPGVGKTRLVEEMAALAGESPAAPGRQRNVWTARFRPDSSAPSDAVAQLLAGALGTEGSGAASPSAIADRLQAEGMAPARAAELAAAAAGHAAHPDLAGSPVSSANPVATTSLADERAALFRGWIEVLDVLAAGRPALWVLEDLHWTSGDVLAFIDQAGRQPAVNGRLVLGTARPAILERLAQRADLGRADLGRADVDDTADHGAPLKVMELSALDDQASSALVHALVGDALSPGLVEAVVLRSDGTPLFIEELLRSWISIGLLATDDRGAWHLTATPDEISLPETVQQIYAAQLDDLPDDARTLARRASVAGRQVPRRSLDTLQLDEQEAALAVIERRALLVEVQPDPIAGPALGYRHALLRDAGYASLARAERARLHGRLARWYEEIAGSRADEVAEQIAGHYAAALENSSRLRPDIDADLDREGARSLAVSWFERASNAALASAAHESGRSLLRRALDFAPETGFAPRGRLLLRLGEATAYTADMNEGGRLIDEALGLFRAGLDEAVGTALRAEARAGCAEAAAALGRVWVQQLRFADAGELTTRTLDEIGEPDDAGVARLLCVRGWVNSTLTADRSALVDLDRALAIARAVADRPLELEALDWRARVLGELDMAEFSDFDLVEKLALELGDAARTTRAMRARAGFLLDDQAAEVWGIADRAEEITRRHGSEEDLAWIDYLRAEAGFVSGEWDRAIEAGGRAVEVGERNAYHRVAVRTWHVLLPIAGARGDRALLEHGRRWYLARAGSFPDSPYARIVEAAANVHFMRAGLLAPAPVEVGPRLSSFDSEPGGPSWLDALETVFETWLAAGELDGARSAHARLSAATDQRPDVSFLGRGVVRHLNARLLAAEGAPADVVSPPAREAMALFRRSRAPWWLARALRVLLESGDGGQPEQDELAAIGAKLGLGRTG